MTDNSVQDVSRRVANRIRDAYTLNEAQQVLDWYTAEQVAKAKADERERVRKYYAKKKPQFTKQWIADVLNISRPTLDKWIADPERFTVGAIKILAELQKEKEKLV